MTVTRQDGSRVEGYIFDRRNGATPEDSFVRIIPKDDVKKIAIAYSDIASIDFTGRDTAEGKSWAAWVKKFFEKKAAGETNIQIQPEKLDD